MKKLTSILLVTLLATAAVAQEKAEETQAQKKKRQEKEAATTMTAPTSELFNNVDKDNSISVNNDGTGFLTRFDTRFEGTKGSPYFNSTWLPGVFYNDKGQPLADKPLIKYNMHTKELIMKRPQGDSIVVYPYQVKQFLMKDGPNTYAFVRGEKLRFGGEVLPITYLLQLYEGKYQFLQLLSKNLNKADFKDPYSADRRYDAYADNSEYYLRTATGELVKIRLKKKDIQEALPAEAAKIDALLKESGRSVKTEKDVIWLLENLE